MSIIENLENIEKYGIKKFLGNRKIRRTYSRFEGTICIHKGHCCNCGKPVTVGGICS